MLIFQNEKANKTILKYHYLSNSPPTIKLFFAGTPTSKLDGEHKGSSLNKNNV
jgi:hypothetical protein